MFARNVSAHMTPEDTEHLLRFGFRSLCSFSKSLLVTESLFTSVPPLESSDSLSTEEMIFLRGNSRTLPSSK